MPDIFNFENVSLAIKSQKVDLSQWTKNESYVWVKELTAGERDALNHSIRSAMYRFNEKTKQTEELTDTIGTSARIAMACCRDDDGNLIFADKGDQLSRMPSGFVDAIVQAFNKLSEQETQNDIEKN